MSADFYSFTAKDAQLNEVSMNDYKGKVVMVVNVASKCGFTKQYGMLYNNLFPNTKTYCIIIIT